MYTPAGLPGIAQPVTQNMLIESVNSKKMFSKLKVRVDFNLQKENAYRLQMQLFRLVCC